MNKDKKNKAQPFDVYVQPSGSNDARIKNSIKSRRNDIDQMTLVMQLVCW